MNKTISAGILIVIAVAGTIIWLNQSAKSPTTSEAPTQIIAITGTNFVFSPAEIGVKKGDSIKIVLTNAGTYPHDLVIDELGVRTPVINSGETTEISFIADKIGEFEYYCSVNSHRDKGMVGKFIIE